MKRVLSFFLCILLAVSAFHIDVFAQEREDITVRCQYTAKNTVSETTIQGKIVDENLYVDMDTIAEVTGLVYSEQESVLVPSDDYIGGGYYYYTIDQSTGKMTEDNAFYSERTWDIPYIKSENGEFLVSLDHILAATNTKMEVHPEAEVPVVIYRPYTVIDARAKLQRNADFFFEWSEIDEQVTSEDVKLCYQLSSLNSLFLDYNSHFITDGLFSWWNDEILNVKEEQYMDTMIKIMTEFSSFDPNAMDEMMYQTFQLQTDTFSITNNMMELLGIEDSTIDLLGNTAKASGTVLKLIDQVNQFLMYRQINESQKYLLGTTFLSDRKNSVFSEDDLEPIRNAAQHLQVLLDDGMLGGAQAICDAVTEIGADELIGATPFVLVDIASKIVSLLPGMSQKVDVNNAMLFATHCAMLELFSREDFLIIGDQIRADGPNEDLLYEWKEVLLFSLQASYTARSLCIEGDLMEENGSTAEQMEERNQRLLDFIVFLQNCSLDVAPVSLKNAYDWSNYLKDSGGSGQSAIPPDAVEFNGHYYYLYDLDTVTTWEEAKEYCESQGGYLATITSQEEDEFLYSYITDMGLDSVLFGLSDIDQENVWTWVTGEPFSYENWAPREPNHQGGYEHYGMYYEKNKDGTWNDGSGKTCPFLCEWGEYQTSNSQPQEPVRTTSDERDIVLVLDTSGSMSGTPIEETKKAATKFVNTILEEDASIGIVTYEDSANQLSDFSIDKGYLTGKVENISDGGGTNIESGLAEAKLMLDSSNAKKKIIVLMSDGEPNEGKEGEDLIAYANDIKSDDILIYTLGFFENMSGSKSSAQHLMEQLASDGCHYEVASADDLVFFFEDMADQINGQKYIYVRIACPVDVSVTYNGETLSSAESALNVRTDFGTLTFEDNENVTSDNEDDRIKVLRLKEGADYDVQIVGTGRGMMDYTIGFMDENGDYSDFRRFEDVKITKRTVIDTVAAVSGESILNIDSDGDGKYDMKLRAEKNGYGQEVTQPVWIYVVLGTTLLIALVLIVFKICQKRKER